MWERNTRRHPSSVSLVMRRDCGQHSLLLIFHDSFDITHFLLTPLERKINTICNVLNESLGTQTPTLAPTKRSVVPHVVQVESHLLSSVLDFCLCLLTSSASALHDHQWTNPMTSITLHSPVISHHKVRCRHWVPPEAPAYLAQRRDDSWSQASMISKQIGHLTCNFRWTHNPDVLVATLVVGPMLW